MNAGPHHVTPFAHQLAAHCESGVTSQLLTRAGLTISEPLAFGIGSGLFFLHLPVERFFGAPTTSFRSKPGTIFGKAISRLHARAEVKTYRSPKQAHDELWRLVDSGQPVGLQTSVYFLEYLPRRFRFPFNAHNIIVYGRRGNQWLVSDPVLADQVECDDDSLERARFAAGLFAPRGRAYWVTKADPAEPTAMAGAIRRGIRETAYRMSHIPLFIFGWKAIAMLARRVEKLPKKYAADPQRGLLQLANVVRMQEEIGTGGAGFRYLYAAFLQEAAPLLDDPSYARFSLALTEIGDRWRRFAGASARLFRSQQLTAEGVTPIAELLHGIAASELALFSELNEHVRGRTRQLLPLPHRSEP